MVRPDRPREPLGIAAGGGDLPRIVADEAAKTGWAPYVLAVADGIDADWRQYDARRMPWGQLGDGLRWLKASGVRRLVLCGTVSARPDFRSILPSYRTLMLMKQIIAVIRGGDDTLLRLASKAFERQGFEVLAVQAIAPKLLAPHGHIAGPLPSRADEVATERAFSAARSLGALDIGQAVVASSDRVIALEGIEGTREMLGRVADLRRRGRIGSGERCVLVKCCKPGQDARFDLPSIGASTIAEAAEAGLKGIAVSAGRSLLVGLEDIGVAARRDGVFLVGHDEISGASR